MQPVQLHGSLGREAATGRGTVFATRELLKHSRAGTIAGKSFVIQVGHASASSVLCTGLDCASYMAKVHASPVCGLTVYECGSFIFSHCCTTRCMWHSNNLRCPLPCRAWQHTWIRPVCCGTGVFHVFSCEQQVFMKRQKHVHLSRTAATS